MEDDGTIEKVREMLQRYSSGGGSFSEGSFLSDIDVQDEPLGSAPEELVGRIVRSLKSCREMVEMAKKTGVCISGKQHSECMEALGSISSSIGGGSGRRGLLPSRTTLAISVAIGLVCMAAKYYFGPFLSCE